MITPVRGIPAGELDTHWHAVEPLVEKLLAETRGYASRDVYDSLKSGQWQLFAVWPSLDTICITYTAERPRERVLVLFGKAGKLHPDWRDMLTALEDWGRAINCTAVEIYGRDWRRLLPDYKASFCLRKELT